MVIIGAHAIIIARKSICAHCAALTNNIIIFYTINKLDCIALVIHNRSERPILKNSADGKLDAVESAFLMILLQNETRLPSFSEKKAAIIFLLGETPTISSAQDFS